MDNIQTKIEGFRLSPQQRRLWQLQSNDSAVYKTQAVISIEGALQPQNLATALEKVIQQHEILRTSFQRRPEMALPVQVIHDGGLRLEHRDFSEFAATEQNAKIAALRLELKNRPCALDEESAVHFCLVALTSSRHLLIVTMPALCADASSLNLLAREISRAYASAPLDEAMQYADIAEWQNQLLESADGEMGRTFWQQQEFRHLLAATLPFETDAISPFGFDPQYAAIKIPGELAAKLVALAQKYRVPTSQTLFALYKILLWRLNGENAFAIGVSYDGRAYDELKNALGLLTKYLPVHCALAAHMPFQQVLAQVHAAASQAGEWQDFFSWENLNETTSSAASPRFPFCFDFNESTPKFSAGDVTFSIQQQEACVERYKIKFVGEQRDNAVTANFYYDANFFQAMDIGRLAENYLALAASAVAAPETAIGELDMLAAAERQYLVYDYNHTAAEYPTDKCIHHFIEAQAQQTPDRVAVEFQEQALTYGELNRRANQLARRLRALGVKPEVLVGICVERSPDMIIGMLAILKAGGAYVPLDPNYPKERLEFILTDTQTPVLLTKKSVIDRLKFAIENFKAKIICLDENWKEIAGESGENFACTATPGNRVYIIYTSGSTGKPKGVIISHQDLVISNLARLAYFKQPVDKFLLLSSLSFDSSVVGIFWTLCEGGVLFLVPESLQQNMPELAALIAQQQISHLLTLPSFYALLMEYAQPGQLKSLRNAIVAGEACPLKMVERHKTLLPQTQLFSEYGATETTVFSSVYDCRRQTLNIAPVGDPIANAQMYVLNADLQPLPFYGAGEVLFGGEALAKGYLNRPDLTAERFIPNPFSHKAGERLYKSGDLARHLPNGDLEFLGRLDNQVKIRGFRIELEEIEAVLGQHPSVREVAVEARSSHGGKRLIAYVALRLERPATISELRRYLAEKLPDYMVPAQFVKLDHLPKNPNGKIDRRALPDPGEERPELAEDFVAAQTAVEKKLTEIWAEVLRVDRVGIHDNFFELGGDSILSIQIISKANRAGLRFTPVQLFQYQTIAELAKVAGAAQMIHAEQNAVTGPLPLTPIQYWFFEKELPAPDHWNVSLLLEVRSDITEAHFQRAAQKLLEQHDALRLRFKRDSGWRQTMAEVEQACPFDCVDLSALQGEAQLAAIEEKTMAFQAQLNLAQGPLMRFVLFERGAAQSPYLLWVLHHLVCDIVSWRIMLEDFQSALEQLRNNAPLQLPAKTTSFKYWAERLVEYAQGQNVRAELDYWLTAIPTPPPALPFDFQNELTANTEESTGVIKFALDEKETRALLQDVPKVYNTQINDVLLTALAQTIAAWTGEASVLIDMEGHGREDIFSGVDLSRTVGWFTIFYPVLLTVENNTAPGAAVRGIKEQLRRIPSRGLGYSLLRYLHHDPDAVAKMRRLPVAQINFNYLGQFDQTLQASSLFGLVQETNIYDRSPRGIRSHVLEIVGTVIGGCLQIEWSYSENLHRAATIADLAQKFFVNLRAIIRPEQTSDAQDFTTSDFAEFNWDQADLASIAAAIAKSQR